MKHSDGQILAKLKEVMFEKGIIDAKARRQARRWRTLQVCEQILMARLTEKLERGQSIDFRVGGMRVSLAKHCITTSGDVCYE